MLRSPAERQNRRRLQCSENGDLNVAADLHNVNKHIDALYVGIELESSVQGWVYLEKYENGVQLYAALAKPTPQDDRWLGVCYSMLGERMHAQEVLWRAAARGNQAAKIELARVLSFLDRDEEASLELDSVEPQDLSPADQVLWYRAKSLHEEYLGCLKQATEFAEMAWRQVQGLPEFPLLAPWTLIRLGTVLGQTGHARRALWCYERALDITQGSVRWDLRLSRAKLLIDLGRTSEAMNELEALNTPEAPKSARSARTMLQATTAWAMGDMRCTVGSLGKVIEQALEDEATNTELNARLALAPLLGNQGAFETAAEHFARAQILLSSKRDRLDYQFRETLLDYWRGASEPEATVSSLHGLIGGFGEMGLLREEGWVRLHLAGVYYGLGDNRYLTELDKVQALTVALQNRAFLACEWTLLPHLREAARISHPKVAGDHPAILEIYSLGQEKLVLGGQVVNIRLRRGVEVLCYFLERGEVSLTRLRADVFADDDPKAARNYFHQFKHEIGERLPELSFDYDPVSRVYRLASKLDILWDVAELRAGRKMGELGVFLPGSGSDWAYDLDSELEPLRSTASSQPRRRLGIA